MGSNKASKLNKLIARLTKAAKKAKCKKRTLTLRNSQSTLRDQGRMNLGLANLNSPIPMFRSND